MCIRDRVISQLSGVTCESGGAKMKAPRTGCRKDANLLMGTSWVEVEVDFGIMNTVLYGRIGLMRFFTVHGCPRG